MSKGLLERALMITAAAVALGCDDQEDGGTAAVQFAARSAFMECRHMERPVWSDYDCPDGSLQWIALSDVDSMALVVRTTSGQIRITPIRPGTDAIFLSQRAVDSIFVPYYLSKGLTAKADSLREASRRP